MTKIMDADTFLKFVTIMEEGTFGETGWDNGAVLTTFHQNAAGARLAEVHPKDWTIWVPGLCPDGVNGELAHDLALYATRAKPLDGFQAIILVYENDPNPDQGYAGSRVLLAIDQRGNRYRVERHRDTGNTTAALAHLDDDEHLTILDRLADALRGGPAVHEYTFDLKVFCTATVNATSEAEARALVADVCDIDAGTTVQGVSITHGNVDGEPDLVSVDGEDPS